MQVKPLPLIVAVLVLLIAGGVLWFVLTRTPSEEGGPTATSTPMGVDTGKKVPIKDSGTYYDIEGFYPSKTPLGASANASAVLLMKSFVEKEIARFKDNNVDSLTPEDIRVQGLGGERKYVLEMDYDAKESNTTVSYVFHMYADTLGAHPNAYYRTFTFNKKTGEGVLLDDVFSSEAYLETLSEASRALLTTALGDNASPDMLEAGTTPFADNFQNFYFEPGVFVIIFPPYQVGPWAIGTQEVRIPLKDLSAVLRPEYQ